MEGEIHVRSCAVNLMRFDVLMKASSPLMHLEGNTCVMCGHGGTFYLLTFSLAFSGTLKNILHILGGQRYSGRKIGSAWETRDDLPVVARRMKLPWAGIEPVGFGC